MERLVIRHQEKSRVVGNGQRNDTLNEDQSMFHSYLSWCFGLMFLFRSYAMSHMITLPQSRRKQGSAQIQEVPSIDESKFSVALLGTMRANLDLYTEIA